MDAFDLKLIQYITFGKGLVKDPCADRKHKLLSLLNLLCNDTQNASSVNRDACYGCFFRAALLSSGGPLLTQLSLCATLYLNNTSYRPCAVTLASQVSGITPTTAPNSKNCYTGYCQFVQCIRRINSILLIDGCFSLYFAGTNFTSQTGRVAFYTNWTSCILASSRCDPYNPITGIFQGIYGSQAQLNQYMIQPNALQITPLGDIRIVSFPKSTYASDNFCTSSITLDQSTSGFCSVI